MSSHHSSDPPRTPARTWTTMSSSSRPDSYTSEDSSEDHMRRIIVSPPPTDRDYDDDTTDAEEVEAALNAVDSELSTTEDALTDWASRTLDPYTFQPRILSMITERTEEASRPNSFRSSTFGPPRPASATNFSSTLNSPLMRPENPAPRSMTPSSLSRSSFESFTNNNNTARSASPERALRHAARPRAGDLIAFFEERTASDSSSSLSSLGNPRPSSGHLRSPTYPVSPTTTSSSRILSELSPSSYASPSYAHSTFPRSTTHPTLDTSRARSTSPTKSTTNLSTLLSPARTSTTDLATTRTQAPILTPAKQLPRVPVDQPRPRSPISSARNIVAAWKERTPPSESKPSSVSGSEAQQGFFSIRRRDILDVDRNLPALPVEALSRKSSNGNGRKSRASTVSGRGSFDIRELGPFAQPDREPIRIGQLWYLNVHASPPYRWLHTQAILYPHSLVLSWIAPGGGRGVVTLDLLNCNEVRSVPSPSHPSARDDVGTIAAFEQASENSEDGGDLVEMLCPFQLLYPDGVERLGAESARDRVRWVGAIWEALNRALTLPDPSVRSHSPARSLLTISSERSDDRKSRSSDSGSASTVFVPPIDTIPDISSSASVSARSSLLDVGPGPTLSEAGFHHRRASDDNIILDAGMLYPLERRGSKALSRASSLRRTSSLENLDAEFMSAVSRQSARSSTSSAGIGLGGRPVTVSSGLTAGQDVIVTPPPSAGKKRLASGKGSTATTSGSESGYKTPPSRLSARTTATSSYYSLASTSPGTATSATPTQSRRPDSLGTATVTGSPLRPLSLSTAESLPNIVASTLSLRGSRSASLLGDSGDDSDLYEDAKSQSAGAESTPGKTRKKSSALMGSPTTTPTKKSGITGLARSPGVRRRLQRSGSGRVTSGSSATPSTRIEGSDKENEEDAATRERDAIASPGTPTERSYRTGTNLAPPSVTTGRSRRTGRTGSHTATSSIGFDVCGSSDLSDLEGDMSSSYPETMSVRSEGPEQPGQERDEDVFLSAPGSERTSYRSLSPSSTHYTTASQGQSTEYGSLSTCKCTEYDTARTCSCGSSSSEGEFKTAELCTEYETAEVCPSTPSARTPTPTPSTIPRTPTPPPISRTASPTPSQTPTIPSSTSSSSRVPPSSTSERSSIAPSSRAPSVMETIPSETSSVLSYVPSTRMTPITPISTSSESGMVPTATPRGSTIASPSETSLISPGLTTTTEEEIIESPSETETFTPSVITISSTSTPTIEPLSSTSGTYESEYASPTEEETSGSYSSSFLQPSPTSVSAVMPEMLDTDFESSCLRPSGSIPEEELRELMDTPRAKTVTERSITPIPIEKAKTPTPTPTPPPSTPSTASTMMPPPPPVPATPQVSSPTTVPTPIPTPREQSLHLSLPSTTSLTTLSRSPSSVSSISMRSSLIGPSSESLYDFESSGPTTESSVWPSSLSTESSASTGTIEEARTFTEYPPIESSTSGRTTPIPVPRSPSTPERTFTVSISTPYSNAPSIISQLETVPSTLSEPERRPSEIFTHDVNRLLEYMHSLDGIRNGQHGDLLAHLDRIEGGVKDLVAAIKEKDKECPPPVPLKDVSVGRSTPAPSTPMPAPPSSPSVTYLSVPPERPSSPSSITTSVSWLSSHHSDDYTLMPIEDVENMSLVRVGSPSEPSSPTSSSSSQTATPTTAGTTTAESLPDVRDLLANLLGDIALLRSQQNATNDLIAAIHAETRGRPTTTREVPVQTGEVDLEEEQRSCRDMLRGIEAQLERLGRVLERSVSDVSPTTTGTYSSFPTLDGHTTTYPAPPIISPTPQRPGPLSDLLASLPPLPSERQPIVLDPLPTIHRPASRARPRSYTPPLDHRRSMSVPPFGPGFPMPQVPPFAPPGSPPDERFESILRNAPVQQQQHPYRFRTTPGPPQTETVGETEGPDQDIDMLRALQQDRRVRRPDAPDGYYYPQGPPVPEVPRRPPTAPAEAVDPNPARTLAYARDRRRAAGPSGTATDVPPGMSPTGYNEILQLLRAGARVNEATLTQASQTADYLNQLNRWLEQDTNDRQNEIRGLGARIDELRNEIAAHLLGIRPAGQRPYPPGFVPIGPGAPPAGQSVYGGPPGFPYPSGRRPEEGVEGSDSDRLTEEGFIPPRPGTLGGRFPPGPGLPPGFVPTGPPPGMWGQPYPGQFPAGWFPQPPGTYDSYENPRIGPRYRRGHIRAQSPSDEGYVYGRGDDDDEYVPPVPIPRQHPRSPRFGNVEVIPPREPPPADRNAPSPMIIQVPGAPAAPAQDVRDAPSSRPPSPSQQQPGISSEQPIYIMPPPTETRGHSRSRAGSRRGSRSPSPSGYLDRPHSRAGSRAPSRAGSRAPSRAGTRRDYSPGRDSRRDDPDYEHRDPHRSPSRYGSSRPHSDLRDPTVIRVRSPSRAPTRRSPDEPQEILVRPYRSRSGSRSPRRSYSRGPRSRAPSQIIIGDPSRTGRSRSGSRRPRSRYGEPTEPPIVVNVPSRPRSRSSSRGSRGPRQPPTILVQSQSRPRSRSRSRSYTPPHSQQPIIIQSGSRGRSHDRHSRSRHRSGDQPPVIIQDRPRSRSRSYSRGSRRAPVVVVPQRRSSRSRSRSRTPPPQTVIMGDGGGYRSSRSHSRHHGSRAAPVIIGGGRRSSRSRSRSRTPPPQTVIMGDGGGYRSSGSHSHRHGSHAPVIIGGGHRSSRSRSRTPPPQVIVQGGRSHSRHSHRHDAPPVIIPRPRSRSRSYSPGRQQTVFMGDPHGRRSSSRRSHAPMVVVPGHSRSRSRDRHSQAPIIMQSDHHRSRSRPRSQIIMRGRSRSRSRSPEIIMAGSGHHSPRRSHSGRPHSIIYSDHDRHRSRSPTHVVLDSHHGGRSRSRSRPHTVVIPTRSRSRSPILMSRAPSHVSHREPTVVFGDSPSRPHSVVHAPRSHSRHSEYPQASYEDHQVVVPTHRPESYAGTHREHSPPLTDFGDAPRPGFHSSPIHSRPRSRAGSIDYADADREPTHPHVRSRAPSGAPSRIGSVDYADADREPGFGHTPMRSRAPSRAPSRGESEVPVVVAPSRPGSRRTTPQDMRESDAPDVQGQPHRDPVTHPHTFGVHPEDVGGYRPPRHGEEDGPAIITVRPSRSRSRATTRPATAIPSGYPSDSPREYEPGSQPYSRAPTVIMPHEDEDDGRRTPTPYDRPGSGFRPPESVRTGSPPIVHAPIHETDFGTHPPTRVGTDVSHRTSPGTAPTHHLPGEPRVYGDASSPEILHPGERTPILGSIDGDLPGEGGEDRFAAAFNNAEDERRALHAEAERRRQEAALEAEQRRDETFHEHEDSRQQHFEENEQQREARAEAAMRDLLHATRPITPAPRTVTPAGTVVPSEYGHLSYHEPDLVPVEPVGEDGEPVFIPGTPLHSGSPPVVGPSRLPSEGGLTRPSGSVAGTEAERDGASLGAETQRDRDAEEAEMRRQYEADQAELERASLSGKSVGDRSVAASQVAASVLSERESWRKQLQACEEDRERLMRMLEESQQQLQAETEKVRMLEQEVVTIREVKETERIEREREETERRERCEMEATERDNKIQEQLGEITDLLKEKMALCEQLQVMNDARNAEKEERRARKDGDVEMLKEMMNRIIDQNESIRTQNAEDHAAQEGKPGIEVVLEALQKQQEESKATLNSMAENWKAESDRQHEETIEAVKETAQEQVPFNIQGYLDQFSRALADEVRMLLGEVGKLREEKRNLQYELGCLMCMRSKYGPGGEFDPNWRPDVPMYGGPPGPGGPPPPGGGPGPDMPPDEPPQPPPPTKPAWRTFQPPQPPKLSKRQRRLQREAEEAAMAASMGPPGPSEEPRVHSWATWQPNPAFAPTPSQQEAELVVPQQQGSPGLFGPRSPRGSFMKPQ